MFDGGIVATLVMLFLRVERFIYFKVNFPIVRQVLLILAKLLDLIFLRVLLGTEIPVQTLHGTGQRIYHPYGIIINRNAVIGSNVIIRHQVTIGSKDETQNSPIIGDGVDIGAGSKILGDIRVGNNVKVGANAVVTKDVPDNATAVGIPAHVIPK